MDDEGLSSDGEAHRRTSSSSSDAIEALLHLEEDNHYISADYLLCSCKHPAHHGPCVPSCISIDSTAREEMVEWTYKVVDFLKFNHQTVAAAIGILDRFMLTEEGRKVLRSGMQFKLATMTCLYIAAKLHEHSVMSSGLLSQLSRGVYTSSQVEECECVILKAMDWHINPPTVLGFCREFLDLLPETLPQDTLDSAFELCVAQSETSVLDYENFCTIKASTVAFFSVMNALTGLGVDSIALNRAGNMFCNATHIDHLSIPDSPHEALVHAMQSMADILAKRTQFAARSRKAMSAPPSSSTRPPLAPRQDSPCYVVDTE